MNRVNLGCGRKQRIGEIGIDRLDLGQKYVLDIEKERLPFEDNSCEYVRADHFLEHLNDVQNTLNEVWRVLDKDGKFEVYVPFGLYENVFSPVHKQIITPYWFRWLEKDDIWELYEYRRWKIVELTTAEKEDGTRYEIHCILTPFK